jgi:hypothetical protein
VLRNLLEKLQKSNGISHATLRILQGQLDQTDEGKDLAYMGFGKLSFVDGRKEQTE